MAGTEDILARCSELALTMADLEKEVPKLKKYFTECQKLHKELCKSIEADECILDEHFMTCQKNLEKEMKKISAAINKYEKTYESIIGNANVIEVIQKNTEMQLQLQKRVELLEARLEKVEKPNVVEKLNVVEKTKSLRNILAEEGFKYPIKVHKEGEKGWSKDYYYEVEGIDAGSSKAYGTTYLNGEVRIRSHYRSLDEVPFVLYKPSTAVAPSFSRPSPVGNHAGFMNIPDGIDEELPFN